MHTVELLTYGSLMLQLQIIARTSDFYFGKINTVVLLFKTAMPMGPWNSIIGGLKIKVQLCQNPNLGTKLNNQSGLKINSSWIYAMYGNGYKLA